MSTMTTRKFVKATYRCINDLCHWIGHLEDQPIKEVNEFLPIHTCPKCGKAEFWIQPKEQPLSIHDNHLGKFQTYSRQVIDFNNIQAADIKMGDITHALSHICRFGGHIQDFYSVAQHSILVAFLAPKELKLVALLHDAAEAYIGDCITPLKNILGKEYARIEERFNRAIAEKFGFDYEDFALVKKYDRLALQIEDDYFNQGRPVTFTQYMHNIHNHFFGKISDVIFDDKSLKYLYSTMLFSLIYGKDIFDNMKHVNLQEYAVQS